MTITNKLPLRSILQRVTSSKLNHRALSTAAATASSPSTNFPNYLLAAPATEISTLPNGLRVASETMLGSSTATVGVWIDAGSRYETALNNGAAHFLEHMAFKGTSKRTQYQLEVEIENMGGHLNAYTSREQTVYFAKVFDKDVPNAIDILADILLRSKLDPFAIQRERDVILREMQEVNKLQEELVLDHLHATAFQGSGLGRTILGPTENIQTLTRNDLRDYITTHYLAPRMVIAGAGAVEHQKLCELADDYFGDLPTELTEDAPDHVCLDEAKFVGSDVRIHFDSDSLAHIGLAFQGSSWTSEYAYPLMLLQTLLGSFDRATGSGKSHSSRLIFDVANNERANSLSTFNTCYKDTGLFGLYAVAEREKVHDLMWCIMNNLVWLVHHVSEDEVERAKIALKATMLMGLDGNTNVCEDIGRQLLTYGRRMTPAEIFHRIEEITVDDVKAAAYKVIHDKDHAMAALGGIDQLPSYEWIRHHTYWVQ